MENQPAAQSGKSGFQAHDQRRRGRIQVLLTDDLQRVGDAHGQNAGKDQGKPAGGDGGETDGFLRQQNEGQGKHRNHQRLNAVHAQTVQISRQPVNAGDLHGKGQGAAHQIQVALVDLRNAHAAEQIQPGDRQRHAEKGGFGRLFPEKQPQHRHQHDVHGGDEPRLSRVGVDDADLLQAGCDEQGAPTDQPHPPQRRILPFCRGFPEAALAGIQQKPAGNQKQHGKQAPRGLKGKGANMIHAHALGDKAKAPNGCTQQQTQTASNAFSPHFHHRGLL